MVLQNPVTQTAQFEVAQKNTKHILSQIFRIFQIWKYLNIAFRNFRSYVNKSVLFQRGGFCRGGNVPPGGSATNMATMSSCKRSSCEKKTNIIFLEYICSQISLRWENSMEWADSLNVDFLVHQNALKINKVHIKLVTKCTKSHKNTQNYCWL